MQLVESATGRAPGCRASARYEVTAVRYGTLRSTKRELYYRYDSYGEPDAAVDMDYFFWVLRGEDQTILVDTGFDPEVGTRRGRTCLTPPLEALQKLGIEIETVSHVVITHFHYDHIGNLVHFPGAELIAPARELEFWTGTLADKLQFGAHVEHEEIAVLERARSEGRLRLTSGTEEILPGVTAITVGGHSPGQQVIVVAGASGDVVLTSDAVHFYAELEVERPFGVIADLAEMYAAYELIKRLADRPGATVVAGHDPEVMQRFKGSHQGMAVQVMR